MRKRKRVSQYGEEGVELFGGGGIFCCTGKQIQEHHPLLFCEGGSSIWWDIGKRCG